MAAVNDGGAVRSAAMARLAQGKTPLNQNAAFGPRPGRPAIPTPKPLKTGPQLMPSLPGQMAPRMTLPDDPSRPAGKGDLVYHGPLQRNPVPTKVKSRVVGAGGRLV